MFTQVGDSRALRSAVVDDYLRTLVFLMTELRFTFCTGRLHGDLYGTEQSLPNLILCKATLR